MNFGDLVNCTECDHTMSQHTITNSSDTVIPCLLCPDKICRVK